MQDYHYLTSLAVLRCSDLARQRCDSKLGVVGEMDEELNQCIPSLVARLEEQRYTSDLNLMEWFMTRAELFLELLHVLMYPSIVCPPPPVRG